MSTITRTFRQGLPRVRGGDPWPPLQDGVSVNEPNVQPATTAKEVAASTADATAIDATPVAATTAVASTADSSTPAAGFSRADLRQGLPRVKGGEPWPPRLAAETEPTAETAHPTPESPAIVPAAAASTPTVPSQTTPTPPTVVAPAQSASSQQPAKPKVPPAAAAANTSTSSTKEEKKFGLFTSKQWILVAVVGLFCAIGVATTLVAGTRWLLGFETMSNFIERYPGSYELPEATPIGIPVWMSWQHFLNFFLIVLIIRAGLQVRREKKPPAYWSSKRSPKVSINLWFHLVLDALWLINGLIFVILLFATGHWMRIVPTSWEVFPNAISAGLQYLSLDWPTENGWVHYNALQQLAYFSVVFLAAPLAAITGVRMSAYWPKNLAGLSRIYPVEVARKLHFPTMLFFVVFIFIHVALVFSTGALRNLNHMYAAQGSVDPNEFASNWTGFWLFGASLLVIAAAWAACRPMFLVPIARLFGNVSSR